MSNATTYNEALGKNLEHAKRLQGDVDRVRKIGNEFTNWEIQSTVTRLEAAHKLAKAVVEAEETLKLVKMTMEQLQTLLEDYGDLRDRLLTVQATGRATIVKALPGN